MQVGNYCKRNDGPRYRSCKEVGHRTKKGGGNSEQQQELKCVKSVDSEKRA